jgi:nitrate/nitrite transporter NarK
MCQEFHSLTFAGIPLLLPLIREDLLISFAQAGLLSAAATLTYALGQIPAGYLADRFGPRRVFFVGLLDWSVVCITIALTRSIEIALANQVVAGAFRALLFAPGLTLLSSWFPPHRRATAMSLYMVGGFAGNVVLSLAGPVLAIYIGWRSAFILFASLGILAAIAYRSFAKDKPRKQAIERVRILDAARLFRHRILWICSALQFVRFTVVTAFVVWLPSVLLADRGFTLEQAGFVIAMSAAFSAPSNALGAYVSDRLRNPPLVIGGSLAILACTSVLLVSGQSVPALLAVIGVASVFMQFYFGPLFLVPVEVFGQRTAGVVTGFSNLFANLGGLCTAYALGAIKDRAGSFTWGFVGIATLCLIGVALSLLLAAMRKSALAARQPAGSMLPA